MHMVANTSNLNGCAFRVVYYFADIGVHTFEIIIKNTWTCGLDVEYNVQIDFTK